MTFLGLMPTSKKKAFCELERGVRPRIEMFPKQFQVWPDLGHMLLFCESYKQLSDLSYSVTERRNPKPERL